MYMGTNAVEANWYLFNPTTILNQEAAKLCLSATPFLPAIVKRHLVQHTEIIEMHTSFTLHAGYFAGYVQGTRRVKCKIVFTRLQGIWVAQ